MSISIRSICVLVLAPTILIPQVALAEESAIESADSFNERYIPHWKEIKAGCIKEFANHNLDLLRGKMPMWNIWMENPTNEMRSNENKPNAAEKTALRAYLKARYACDSLFDLALESDDNARKRADHELKKQLDNEINPLINGKITFAEYARRKDQDEKETNEIGAKIEKELSAKALQIDPKRYENYIESWLAPSKPNYPANSPWWGFYSDAIATAKDVDSGKLSDESAWKLIDERRLKFNQELAALSAPKLVTLNCAMTGKDGRQVEKALTIDYTNTQVNGQKAEFYENEIHWSTNNGTTNYYFTLNRLSGFLNASSDRFPGVWAGRCAPATKQF